MGLIELLEGTDGEEPPIQSCAEDGHCRGEQLLDLQCMNAGSGCDLSGIGQVLLQQSPNVVALGIIKGNHESHPRGLPSDG